MEPIMKWIVGILAVVHVFFAPVKGVFFAVGVAIILDTFFGVMRARKVKEPITSRRLSNVIRKMLQYEVAMLGMYLIDKWFLHEITFAHVIEIEYLLTKVIGGVFIFIEIFSIDESWGVIFGKRLSTQVVSGLRKVRLGTDEIKKIKE